MEKKVEQHAHMWRHIGLWIALSTFGFAAMAVMAQTNQFPVAYVRSMDGEPENFALIRAGKKLQFREYLDLYEGDRVTIVDEGASFELWQNGKIILVKHSDSPYPLIRSAGPAPSLPMITMKLVSEWFERFYKDYQGDAATAGVRASERTQGKHIYAPLFSGEHVALVAGPRELRFSWLGGTPPYQLKLYKKGETSAIVSAERINDSRYKTKRITLSPGEYELEIGDTNGDSQKELIVAGTATIPQQPQELRDSRMPEDDRSVLFAAWLAAQGNGKWIFEAYQRIAEIPEAYTPAIKLRQALELGIVPASP